MTKLDNKKFSLIDIDQPYNQMIRFVVSRNNFLIPDLYSEFQGKEFFVNSSKDDLINFSKKFKDQYEKTFDKNTIVELIEKILLKHIIGILSLARKARKVVIGVDEIKLQLNKNKIFFLIQTNNFSPKKREQLNIPIFQKSKITCFTKEELGIAFGKKAISNIGFFKSSFINPLICDACRLQNLRN